MINKTYLWLSIIAIILIAGGIYWYSQQTLIDQELTNEVETLSEDIADIEEINQDTRLKNLDEDLSAISGEEPGAVNINSIISLESELNDELESFSDELSNLDGFDSDASLNNLDSDLSGVSQ